MIQSKKPKRPNRNEESLTLTRSTQYHGLKPYFMALRPRQWTKNLIVFAAPLFAFNLSPQTLLASAIAYVLFCCTSSSFYLVNDILDVQSDRQHPTKCKRPIAAGLVPIPTAWSLAIGLLLGALILGWRITPGLGAVLSAYAVLQVGYNLKLKHTVILDVVAISVGFVLRAYGGAIAAQIPLSAWFVMCTAMLALFLGIEKRKAELRIAELKGKPGRAVLQRYSLPLLTRMESTVTTGTITTYALWSAGPVLNGASTPWMLLTTPFVLYGIFRYQLLSDPEEAARRGNASTSKTERPEEVLLTDLPILLTVVFWGLTTLSILALRHRGIL